MTTIAVICSGGLAIGYGHFMRALAFQAAAPAEVKVKLFALAAERDWHLFRNASGLASLHSSEPDLVAAVEADPSTEVVVWDTVDWTDAGFSRLRRIGRIHASISPVFRHIGAMDLVFTRNIGTPDLPGVSTYRGYQFAVFGSHCTRIGDAQYEAALEGESLTVGISMGGADAPSRTLQVLRALAQVQLPLTLWVLLGEGNAHSYGELVEAIRHDTAHEIVLAKTNRSAWAVLGNCSVAVLAGGLMMIEALYAGLPSINIFDREEHEQVVGVEPFKRGAAISVGVQEDQAFNRLRDHICDLHVNRAKLLRMRHSASGFVDADGARRIHALLQSALQSPRAN